MRAAGPTRDRLVAAMAAHVLRHGLADASLRPLARAAGTSDRMLIYHFGSKDRLIAALLAHLAAAFEALLTPLMPAGRFADADEAVRLIVAAQKRPDLADYARLWLEIVAAAARGSAIHRETGAEIIAHLGRWLAERMPEAERDAAAAARAALARIEGEMVLWALEPVSGTPAPRPPPGSVTRPPARAGRAPRARRAGSA
jgi:AcrR family transcriptional regulator